MHNDLKRMQGDRRNALHFAEAMMALAVSFVGVSVYAGPGSQTAAPQGAVAAGPQALTFDAASVKVDTSGNDRHSLSVNLMGGRLRGVNVSLSQLMLAAYKVPYAQIAGAPSWFDSEFFDVEATHEDPGPDDAATDDGNQLRLQALLADRFKLAVHHENRQMPIYALVLANPPKMGPNLHINKEHCDASLPTTKCSDLTISYGTRRDAFEGRNLSMQRFLLTLAGTPSFPTVDRPLVDETGIVGNVDFAFEFAPFTDAGAYPEGAVLSSLPTALEEQLGLKLKSETGPVDVIVIDHVVQPSGN
jgi:uncharacterized protein (TIGR03435 family)